LRRASGNRGLLFWNQPPSTQEDINANIAKLRAATCSQEVRRIPTPYMFQSDTRTVFTLPYLTDLHVIGFKI
jgi:hypothetical protein